MPIGTSFRFCGQPQAAQHETVRGSLKFHFLCLNQRSLPKGQQNNCKSPILPWLASPVATAHPGLSTTPTTAFFPQPHGTKAGAGEVTEPRLLSQWDPSTSSPRPVDHTLRCTPCYVPRTMTQAVPAFRGLFIKIRKTKQRPH